MQTLIALTDFSPAALNATTFAATLCQKGGYRLHLLHVYQLPLAVSDVPVLTISIDELKQGTESHLALERTRLLESFAGLDISIESRPGDINDELRAVVDQISPFAMVIGKRSENGLEKILFGNTAVAVIRHATRPLLVVPENWKTSRVENAVLAVDQKLSQTAAAIIKSFCASLDCQLTAVHVSEDKENKPGLQEEPTLGIPVKQVHGKSFIESLHEFIKATIADIVIILPHHHSWRERLFGKQHTSEVIGKLDLPILCIPEMS